MKTEEKVLLSLLKHAISDNSWDEFCEIQPVLNACEGQKVEPLLFDLLETAGIPIPKAVHNDAVKSVLQFWHLFAATKQLCDLFSDSQIRCVVLKGVSAAIDYPVMEYRKSGDIDILISCEDLESAENLLISNGYIRTEEQKATHHVAFTGPDGINVEVHSLFAEPFDNEEANRKLMYYSAEAMNHMHYEEIEGVRFPLLDDAYQALSLLLHMLQHYLRAGFGLKLLTDWVVFWNKHYSEGLCKEYLTIITDMKIDGFSDLITSVCVKWLGLKNACLCGTEANEELCEQFLDDIFAGGEFGRAAADRMVNLRSGSLFDYIREFHHQMCLNHPEASKNVILWPFLWVITLVVFLYNNITIRHTSALKILKTAGKRSKLNESIHLFTGFGNESRKKSSKT